MTTPPRLIEAPEAPLPETLVRALARCHADPLDRRLFLDASDGGQCIQSALVRALADEVLALREQVQDLTFSREWAFHRLQTLQDQQQVMRDPERKMVCDILANGRTYQTPHDETPR